MGTKDQNADENTGSEVEFMRFQIGTRTLHVPGQEILHFIFWQRALYQGPETLRKAEFEGG